MNLKFGKVKRNKKEFHRWKQPSYLNQVEISKIVISDDFKLDDGVKNFIGCKNDKTVKPLCIFYLRWVDLFHIFKTTKNMPFLADDDDIILKYNKIWQKIKKLFSVQFVSQPCLS